jgi:hypothetical protein
MRLHSTLILFPFSLILLGHHGSTPYVFSSQDVINQAFPLQPNPTYITDHNTGTSARAYYTYTPLECPFGDFSPDPAYPNLFCVHTSGSKITGHALIDASSYQPSGPPDLVSYKICNENSGCTGTGCGTSTYTLFYVTGAFDPSTPENTVWTYKGYITTPYDNCSDGYFAHASGIEAVVVARSAHGNHAPDPLIHHVELSYAEPE